MATQFFSDEQMERLRSYPDIGREELIRFFTLTRKDLGFVDNLGRGGGRGPAARLGLAVQLCTLPWLGFVPDDIWSVPQAAVLRLANQLTVSPGVLGQYGRRAQTISDHLKAVLKYLDWKPVPTGGEPLRELEQFLQDRAMEHDTPSLLFHQAAEFLVGAHVTRPGVVTLMEMVATARTGAGALTSQKVGHLLTGQMRGDLDRLLAHDAGLGMTRLTWLTTPAVEATSAAFTPQEWDPAGQRLQDWLALRMQEAYPVFGGKAGAADAARLIAAGKIAVILDGLDEMPTEAWPVALQALTQQATFRVVVLARTAEIASAAAQQGVLEAAAAIELQSISPADAADFLRRVQLDPPPNGWQALIDRILSAPESPLAQALDSPLTLTLVRDTYLAGDDIRELLDFCDAARPGVSCDRLAEDITDHLLDRVLPAAYTPRPGEGVPPYDLHTAQRTLAKIAARMNQDGTRDLQWWRIPEWAPGSQPNRLTSLFAFSKSRSKLLGSLIERWGIDSVLFGTWGHNDAPKKIGKVRLRHVPLPRLVTLLVILVPAVVWVVVVVGVVAGVVFGLALCVAAGVMGTVTGAIRDWDDTSSISPLTSWRSDWTVVVVVVVAAAVMGGLMMFGLMFGLLLEEGFPGGVAERVAVGATAGLMFGPVLGLVVGLPTMLGFSRAGASTFAFIWLARRWHAPHEIP